MCPKESFKNVVFGAKKDDILKNLSDHIYTWNDFFHQRFLRKLKDWTLHETFNPKLGLCFSLKFNQKVTLSPPYPRVELKKGNKYQVCDVPSSGH